MEQRDDKTPIHGETSTGQAAAPVTGQQPSAEQKQQNDPTSQAQPNSFGGVDKKSPHDDSVDPATGGDLARGQSSQSSQNPGQPSGGVVGQNPSDSSQAYVTQGESEDFATDGQGAPETAHDTPATDIEGTTDASNSIEGQ